MAHMSSIVVLEYIDVSLRTNTYRRSSATITKPFLKLDMNSLKYPLLMTPSYVFRNIMATISASSVMIANAR